ncbi:unnamed protein product [Agarophyton chilense]
MLAFTNVLSAYSHSCCRASFNPLEDRRVLVAAPKAYAARICTRLIEKSARPIHAPLISNKSLPDSDLFDLEDAILRLSDYDIVIFISPIAIKTFAQKLKTVCEFDDQVVLMLRASGIRIATFGANGNIVSDLLGVTPDILPPEPSLAGLAEYLANDVALRGARVLYPIPKFIALESPIFTDFKKRLTSAGLVVISVLAYSTMPIARRRVKIELGLLLDGSFDALLFSSQIEANALRALLSDSEQDVFLSLVQTDRTLLIAHDSYTAAAMTDILGAQNVTTLQGRSSYQGVINAMEEKFMEEHSENGLLLPS